MAQQSRSGVGLGDSGGIFDVMGVGMRRMEQTMRSGLDLIRMSLDASRTTLEAQARAQDLWSASLAAWKSQAQAMTRMSSRAFEFWTAWADLVRGSMGSMAGAPGSKV